MKKNSILILLLLMRSSLYATIGSQISGGRLAGMSGGYTAVADDVFSLQYNPAGIARLSYAEIATSIGSPHMNLTDGTNLQKSFIGFVYPFRNIMPWKKTEVQGKEQGFGIGWDNFIVESMYKETILYLAYSQKLYPRFSWGINLKQLTRAYGSDVSQENAVDNSGNYTFTKDSFFNAGKSKSAVTGDLGLLYRFGEFTRYSFGMSLRNITQPDLSIGNSPDKIPFTSVMGFAYRFPKLNASIDWARGRMLNISNENKINMVGEKWFLFDTRGRAGIEGSLGFGSRNYRVMGIGASYLYQQIRLDYSFSMNLRGLENLTGNHYISFSFKFGIQDPEEYFSPELHEKRQRRREAEKEIEYARAQREQIELERQQAIVEIESLQKRAHAVYIKKALETAEKAEKKAKTSYQEAYRVALELFDKKRNEGLPLQKQKIFLERTADEFKDKNIDISLGERELRRVTRTYNEILEEYKLTMDYYKKVADRGSSPSELVSILQKILKKYGQYGIDLSEVRRELKKNNK
ncbi:MAG: hypothetical protein ABII23_05080 [bacterium]